MRALFQVVAADGLIESPSPKLDAMKYASWLNSTGRVYSFTANDGRYTVAGAGCQPLTFVQAEQGEDLQAFADRQETRRAQAVKTLQRYGEDL